MNENLNKAKELLSTGEYTCVLANENNVLTSTKNGVAPMLGFIQEKTDLAGYSAADKIAGKAAALLFVSAGVISVYAEVMSVKAIEVFEKYNIDYSYGKTVEMIRNRDNTASCPMEAAVADINEPGEASKALSEALAKLRGGK